jgi:hypothetical protein
MHEIASLEIFGFSYQANAAPSNHMIREGRILRKVPLCRDGPGLGNAENVSCLRFDSLLRHDTPLMPRSEKCIVSAAIFIKST